MLRYSLEELYFVPTTYVFMFLWKNKKKYLADTPSYLSLYVSWVLIKSKHLFVIESLKRLLGGLLQNF